MRDPQNMAQLAQLDVDWMGLIFYDKSPRNVTTEPEAVLSSSQDLERVGVFVDEDLSTILSKVESYQLSLVQLHGGESPDFCTRVRNSGVKVIKAIPVREASDLADLSKYEGSVDYILLDTKTQSKGGSGKKFDWSLLAHYTAKIDFILSGGIDPEDAASITAVEHPRLKGVDLNSRFESSPGMKKIDQLKDFVSEIRSDVHAV